MSNIRQYYNTKLSVRKLMIIYVKAEIGIYLTMFRLNLFTMCILNYKIEVASINNEETFLQYFIVIVKRSLQNY